MVPNSTKSLPISTHESSDTYSSYATNHLSTMYTFDDAEYQRMSRKYAWCYRRFLPLQRNAAVLDVGCGVGHFLKMLESEEYTNCTGIDASADSIEICRRKVKSAVYLTDASAYLQEHPSSADCVVCMHVIEHMPLSAAISFLQLLCGALRPEGTIILATPNGDSPWAGHSMFHDLTHQRLYTSRSLRVLMAEGGFARISIHPEPVVPYDTLTSIRWVLAAGLHLLRKLTFAIEIGPGRSRRDPMIFTQGLIAVARRETWA